MMKRILGRYRSSTFKSDIVSSLMVEGDEEHADDLPDDFVKISTGKKMSFNLYWRPNCKSFICNYQDFPCKVTLDAGVTS